MPLDLSRIPPFNAEQFARVCELVADGMVRGDALDQAGISRFTFAHWMRVTPDIADHWETAKAAGAIACDQAAQRMVDAITANGTQASRTAETKAKHLRVRSAQLHPSEYAVARHVSSMPRPRDPAAPARVGSATFRAAVEASPSSD